MREKEKIITLILPVKSKLRRMRNLDLTGLLIKGLLLTRLMAFVFLNLADGWLSRDTTLEIASRDVTRPQCQLT